MVDMRAEWYLGLTHEGRYKVFRENWALNEGYLERRYKKIWGPFWSIEAARSAIEGLEENPGRSGRFRANPPEAVEIYGEVLAVEARKGGRSMWPKENFRHDFKSGRSRAKVYGLKDGSILIKGPRPLWRMFDYGPEDVA